MNRFSKVIALALAATMVFGSSLTAFASETEPVTTGNSTGSGSSEGHVEKKKMNVVLPTIESGTTPFAYTMDPERLITATSHAKYGDAVEFPASDDTGVYFNNGKKGGNGTDKDNIVYANTSASQKVINKSSHAISLTVTAEVTNARTTDIPLVAADAIEGAEAASLYLGLKVGSDDAAAITGTTATTKTVDIAGVADNYKIAVSSGQYVYQVVALADWAKAAKNGKAIGEEGGFADTTEAQAAFDATWKDASFNLEGAVTEDLAITADTTAPEIKVTWSWEDPEAEPETPEEPEITEPSVSADTVVVGGSVDVTLPEGITITEIQKKKTDGTFNTLPTDYYTLEDISGGKKLTIAANMRTTYASATQIKIVFSEGDPITVSVTTE